MIIQENVTNIEIAIVTNIETEIANANVMGIEIAIVTIVETVIISIKVFPMIVDLYPRNLPLTKKQAVPLAQYCFFFLLQSVSRFSLIILRKIQGQENPGLMMIDNA